MPLEKLSKRSLSNLILKSFLGLAFLVRCLALALFLSAGSLGYWQAWVFLAVWTVSVALVTAYLVKYDQKLLASRVQAGPVAETQKVQQVIQSLASLFFIGLFIVPGLDFRFHSAFRCPSPNAEEVDPGVCKVYDQDLFANPQPTSQIREIEA